MRRPGTPEDVAIDIGIAEHDGKARRGMGVREIKKSPGHKGEARGYNKTLGLATQVTHSGRRSG